MRTVPQWVFPEILSILQDIFRYPSLPWPLFFWTGSLMSKQSTFFSIGIRRYSWEYEGYLSLVFCFTACRLFIYLFQSNLSKIEINEACSLVGTEKVMVEWWCTWANLGHLREGMETTCKDLYKYPWKIGGGGGRTTDEAIVKEEAAELAERMGAWPTSQKGSSVVSWTAL